MGRKAVEAGQTLRWGASYGAEWLFDRWPFRKISGGTLAQSNYLTTKEHLFHLPCA